MSTYKIGDLVERIEAGNGTTCPIGQRAVVIGIDEDGMNYGMLTVRFERNNKVHTQVWLQCFTKKLASAGYREPTDAEIASVAKLTGASIIDTRHRLRRAAMTNAIHRACTIEELKSVMLAMLKNL